MDVAVSAVSENRDKYRDLVRELKNLWNMKVAVIPIVIGALGTVTKGFVQGWLVGWLDFMAYLPL